MYDRWISMSHGIDGQRTLFGQYSLALSLRSRGTAIIMAAVAELPPEAEACNWHQTTILWDFKMDSIRQHMQNPKKNILVLVCINLYTYNLP